MLKLMEKIEYVSERAYGDTEYAKALLESPSEILRLGGIEIPEASDLEFKKFFNDTLSAELSGIAAGKVQALSGTAKIKAFEGAKCKWCTVASWGLAGAIVAIGAGGLAFLTEGSVVVVWLAELAGCSSLAALAFIHTLTVAVSEGVAAVANAICGWIGAC